MFEMTGQSNHNRIDAGDIKRRIDLVAYASRIVELRQRGRVWWGCCPFHAERTPSFKVDGEKQLWKCFGCGKGGDLFTFVMEIERVDFAGALEILSDGRALSLPAPPPARATGDEDAARRRAWELNMAGLLPFADSPAEKYLSRRGIIPALAAVTGCRYHPGWSYLRRPAVVFPIRDITGKLVAAQGRFFTDTKPKTITLQPALDLAGTGVYASDGALDEPDLLIVEGPTDALSLAMAGFPALATCGAGHCPDWLPEVCRDKRVLLAFDADGGGARGIKRVSEVLWRAGIRSYILPILREGTDWNDLLCEYGSTALQRTLQRIIQAACP